MINFNDCLLTLKFKFGKTNNDYMNLKIVHGNNEYSVVPNADDCSTFQIKLNLPDKIVLLVSNKNEFDTVVDEQGNIVQDRYIQLQEASLDGFELNYNFLHKKIKILTLDNNEVISSYFGFNGSVELDFNQSNVFHQVSLLNRET